MTITINNKEYTITRNAEIEYRSSYADAKNWIAMYLTDGDRDYIAWYYVEGGVDNDNFELDMIDYDEPHDIEDLGEI